MATKTPASDAADKRPKGRPRADGQEGAVRAVNITLDEESIAIAKAIHPQTSAAVRLALHYWAEMHPTSSDKR